MTDLRALLGDRYGIRTPAQLAHVLSEKLDDAAPLNVTRRWLPLAEELWERISLPDLLAEANTRAEDAEAKARRFATGEYVTAKFTQAEPETTVSEKRTRRPASDYAELRKLAEACPPEGDFNRWYKADELGDAIVAADRPFIAACSPTVVLGLLDELDHLRTEDIPVIQRRRDELTARVAELEGLVEAECAGRNRLAAMVREVRTHCAEAAEESESVAYVLSMLDGGEGGCDQ